MVGPCNESGSLASDASQPLRASLRDVLARVINQAGLSQTRTAKICATDQPTLSKFLSGRHDSVSTDQLLRWLTQLGCEVEVAVKQPGNPGPALIKVTYDE